MLIKLNCSSFCWTLDPPLSEHEHFLTHKKAIDTYFNVESKKYNIKLAAEPCLKKISLLPLVVHLTQDVINQKSKDLNLLVAA